MANTQFRVKHGLDVTGNVTFSITTSITANGSTGTAGQVLSSNGSAVYWANSVSGGSGYTGSVGFTGSEGIQGPIGYTGSAGGGGGGGGYTGSAGYTGSLGFTGSIGYTGSQGFVVGTNTLENELSADSPYLWYKLDEPSGANIINYGTAGASGNLTLTGTYTRNFTNLLPANSSGSATYMTGITTGANGTSAGLSTANGNWTMESFVVPLLNGSNPVYPISFAGLGETEATNFQFLFLIATTGELQAFWEYGAGLNQYANSGIILESGRLYHLVITKESSTKTVNFFVNGIKLSKVSYTNETTGGSSGFVTIGYTGATSDYQSSKIQSHTLFYNSTILPESRIQAHARAAGLYQYGLVYSTTVLGYTGSQGNIGFTGSSGINGYNGSIGFTGSSASLSISNYVSQAKKSSNQTIPFGTDTDISFDVVDIDPQNWWNTSTNRFTPTIAGYYDIKINVLMGTATSNTDQVNVQIRKNNNTFALMSLERNSAGIGRTINGSKLVYLNGTGDYVNFTVYVAVANQTVQSGGGQEVSWFSATLITNGIGYTGSTGAGFTGSIGSTGFTGSIGYNGSIGFTGSTGFTLTTFSNATYGSTLSWNSDNYNIYIATGQNANLTINADDGSPTEGKRVLFRIKDNGTPRNITWANGVSKGFRNAIGTLPFVTAANKTLYIGAIYNSTDDRWDVIATSQEI